MMNSELSRSVVPLVMGLLLVSSCVHRQLAQTSIGISEVLFAVQDGEQELYDAGLVSDGEHARFNGVLVDALEAGQAYNQSVIAGEPGDLSLVADELGRLAQEIADFTSISEPNRATLAASVDMAVRLISAFRGGV